MLQLKLDVFAQKAANFPYKFETSCISKTSLKLATVQKNKSKKKPSVEHQNFTRNGMKTRSIPRESSSISDTGNADNYQGCQMHHKTQVEGGYRTSRIQA